MVAGQALPREYTQESLELLAQGTCNLTRHVHNTRKFGVPVVVAINAFATDTQAELDLVTRAAQEAGAAGQGPVLLHACQCCTCAQLVLLNGPCLAPRSNRQ